MSYESLLFWIIIIAVVLLLAWFAAKWFISQRMAQTEQVLNSSVEALWRAEEAASYLHNGLGTLPFPTLRGQIDQKLAEVETEYTILTRKLGDLRKPFQPHHDPLLKASWSRLNYQWQRYHEAMTLGTPIQELKEQIPVLGDLLRKPKYLVALYRRELQSDIQTSLKAARELADEGVQGEALASTVTRLEELESRLNREDYPFSSWSISEEVSWESAKKAWQTLEAIEAPVHELSEEVRRWKDRCHEIKPKLDEMDRKLDSLRDFVGQLPASISDLPTERQLRHNARQLRGLCNSARVAYLNQIAIEIQKVIDQADHQIQQTEKVKTDYCQLEANIKAIDDGLSRLNHTLEQLQKTAGNIKLCSTGRAECEHIRNEVERWIGPITAKRTMVELKDHLALSERLKEQARELAERLEAFL